MKIWLYDLFWLCREWLANRLISVAHKLDPEVGYEIERAQATYSVCVRVCRGELKGEELMKEAYFAVY